MESYHSILRYFYPRPPRGGRLPAFRCAHNVSNISIHALREEGDSAGKLKHSMFKPISIHALREEGDSGGAWLKSAAEKFLSTPSARRATIH